MAMEYLAVEQLNKPSTYSMREGVVTLGERIVQQITDKPHILFINGGWAVGKSYFGYALEKGALNAGVSTACYGTDDAADIFLECLDQVPVEELSSEESLVIIARSRGYEMALRKRHVIPEEQTTVVSLVADRQTRFKNSVERKELENAPYQIQVQNRDVRMVSSQPNSVSEYSHMVIDASKDRRLDDNEIARLFAQALSHTRMV